VTVELGAFALVLALALSVAQAAASALAWRTGDRLLAGAGEGAAVAGFAACLIAFAALTAAFVTSDFSVSAVVANSHTDKPLFYRVAGVWGNHEGSMLLWCLALTGCGAAVAVYGRQTPAGLRALVIASQGVLGALFLAFTALASNPSRGCGRRRWRGARSTRCFRIPRSRSIRPCSTPATSASRWSSPSRWRR
jgi:cytochrome c-type biogenesis protein CcmF